MSNPKKSKSQLAAMHCSAFWVSASIKPTGKPRKMLVWVECPLWRGFKVGWWTADDCFAIDGEINADHLVTYWMDIYEPNDIEQERKP